MSGISHSAARIIAKTLVAAGVGSAPGAGTYAAAGSWPVYSPNEPNSPDQTIAVSDTSGTIDGYSMTDGRVEEHYGAQIRVRSADPQEAMNKARAVCAALCHSGAGGVRLRAVTLDGINYCVHSVTRRSGPIPTPDPNSDRRVCNVNVVAHIVVLGE